MRKKIVRLFLKLAAAIVLLLVLLVLALRLPSVQLWAVNLATTKLSQELGTQVRISGVEVDLWGRIVLHDVFVEDQHRDTLAFIQSLRVSSFRWDRSLPRISARTVELQSPVFHLVRYEGENRLNYAFLLDYFGPADTLDTTPNPAIVLNSVQIRNGSFRYLNFNRMADTTGGIDWNRLVVNDIFLDAGDLRWEGDSLFAGIHDLSFRESTGFDLRSLSADLGIRPGRVSLDHAAIITINSRIRGDLAFHLNSIDDFDDFEGRVKMDHTLEASTVCLGDIGYFTSALRGSRQQIGIEGRFRGKVSNLRGKEVKITFGSHSVFRGNFQMDGLPELDQTFISCDIEEFRTNYGDLSAIHLPPYTGESYLNVPGNVQALGDMRFSGSFTGFTNDFVAYGVMSTAIGQLRSDISLREDTLLKDYVYSGTFGTTGFDLGAFAGDRVLGPLTSELKVSGRGLSLDRVDATLSGTIQAIRVNDYTYTNIAADGTFRKRFFDGICSVDDPNLIMDFEGQVDFTGKEPELRFTSDVYHLDLKAIGLLPDFPYSTISTGMVVNIKGFDPDRFEGTLEVSELSYCSSRKDYYIDHLVIQSERGDLPRVTIDSDLVTAAIEGKFSVRELVPSFNDILSNVLPSYQPPIREHRDQTFSLRLDILDFSYVSEIFIPGLRIAPDTRVSLSVDEPHSELMISVISDSIGWQGLQLEGMILDARRPDQSLYLTLAADWLKYGENLSFPGFAIDAHTEADSVYSDIVWGDENTAHEGDIKGKLTVASSHQMDFRFAESAIRVNEKTWNVQSGGVLAMDSLGYGFRDIHFSSGPQLLDVEGIISPDPERELAVHVNDFDLSILNPFLGDDIRLFGSLTGSSTLRDAFGEPISNNDFDLAGFRINNYEVGHVQLRSIWENALRRMRIEGAIRKKDLFPLAFEGYYLPDNEESPLDLVARVKDLDLSFINVFVDREMLGFRGFATGELQVTGQLANPDLEGEATLREAWVDVPYLNCSYQVLDRVGIFPDMFTFDYIPIRDQEGAPGFLTGQIVHDHFGDWSYDLVMDMEGPFLAMNTTEELNPLYYGTAYASGSVNIFGYGEIIEFDIHARTEKGTVMAMPMNSVEEQSFGSFIRFVDKDAVPADTPADLSGIKLNFELDITPDAEFQIIFDEAVGDVMRGRGSGHINMEINNLSTFNMYGTVQVLSGNYLFTLKNLLNKEFTVVPGGTISWFGDPFAADLNLDAVYKVSASLYDLMPDAVTASGQRVPVDLIMTLTGKMLNPGIGFNIQLPTVDELTRSRVESIISTEQERNRQAFSLLVMRRFVAPPNITTDRGSANALAENSTELLSSQISNWLSQISDDFNLGFNYRPGDDISNEEIALALSTQLFNERLLVSGNFGVSRGNQTNQNPTNYIGDIRIEYKITSEGRIRLVVYNESNDFRQITTQQSPYTQGVGVLYQEEFDTWSQFSCGFRQLFVSKDRRSACL